MNPFPVAGSANPKNCASPIKEPFSTEGREENPGGVSHPSTTREPILTIGSVSGHPLPISVSKS